eukprot:CAMPEP_0197628944 /NCGR_PEP_ID=MMETSP1338-20131121/7019_1 /TAXON_ID=43686 ORGANISM="Pelagodinium beii, Strain RCC1491" /NCGR_SAMPLE_ID=MMETSP1338 /ASSEMBLY_ACC=CAM_ASM_000754 /LENGTH=371 /DNA_ID=CAMNT_0043199947 /DNA_START=104 /DNA_END=1216 /DNA_ORIENTATION=+
MLDAGLVLYLGLLILISWRWLSGWRLFGAWLEYANYCVLLYALLGVLNLWGMIAFYTLAMKEEGKTVWAASPNYVKTILLGAPPCALVTYICAFIQTGQHVNEIRRGAAVLKHDRAVQIIALPAVFGCMAMNSLAKMYQGAAQVDVEQGFAVVAMTQDHMSRSVNGTAVNGTADLSEFYLAQTETCFHVADVYEAWALFQFCKMTLEVLRSSLKNIGKSERTAENAEKQEVARGLLVAHSALESIAWVSVSTFLIVCLAQAGWSLYTLYLGGDPVDWTDYNSQMMIFQAAGFVSSGAAIWNVNVVEIQFHEYFEGYGPLLKFLTVKFLLSLAYFQSGAVWGIQALNAALPGVLRNIVNKVPFLADLVLWDD